MVVWWLSVYKLLEQVCIWRAHSQDMGEHSHPSSRLYDAHGAKVEVLSRLRSVKPRNLPGICPHSKADRAAVSKFHFHRVRHKDFHFLFFLLPSSLQPHDASTGLLGLAKESTTDWVLIFQQFWSLGV